MWNRSCAARHPLRGSRSADQIGVLAGSAMVACLLPALRASRIDATTALRSE